MVTHVFIPRRDRLARPDDAVDGVLLENELRESGVTLVFMNAVLSPLRRGQRQDIGEAITAFVEYHGSGNFRDELAEKIIFAQLELAAHGFSTGGRPPFGFRRYLIRDDRTTVRELAEGEIVRQKGHHVVWLPGPPEEIALIRRILEMLFTTPASRVAKILTSEGIPSPDAGRRRNDNGFSHEVSGVWHQPTIVNIARHPLLRALTSYGRRSMGDRRRVTPDGPRSMEDEDYRDGQKPKVIQNPEALRTSSRAHGDPIVPPEQVDQLLSVLDQRAGTQKGKPRSRDPDLNPLGGRITDIACGWPMYRIQRAGTFGYTCGLYQQSHSQKCEHNRIDGATATRFALV